MKCFIRFQLINDFGSNLKHPSQLATEPRNIPFLMKNVRCFSSCLQRANGVSETDFSATPNFLKTVFVVSVLKKIGISISGSAKPCGEVGEQ